MLLLLFFTFGFRPICVRSFARNYLIALSSDRNVEFDSSIFFSSVEPLIVCLDCVTLIICVRFVLVFRHWISSSIRFERLGRDKRVVIQTCWSSLFFGSFHFFFPCIAAGACEPICFIVVNYMQPERKKKVAIKMWPTKFAATKWKPVASRAGARTTIADLANIKKLERLPHEIMREKKRKENQEKSADDVLNEFLDIHSWHRRRPFFFRF